MSNVFVVPTETAVVSGDRDTDRELTAVTRYIMVVTSLTDHTTLCSNIKNNKAFKGVLHAAIKGVVKHLT